MELGEPSIYACPECHGVLLQIREGSNARFRCHTGHAYSPETLLADLNVHTEEALWRAIRSMEETILLLRRMAGRLRDHKHESAAQSLEKQAAEAPDARRLGAQGGHAPGAGAEPKESGFYDASLSSCAASSRITFNSAGAKGLSRWCR